MTQAAYLSRELGDIDSTTMYLSRAIELNPRDPQALMYLGDTLNDRKQFSRAVALYKRAVKLDRCVVQGGVALRGGAKVLTAPLPTHCRRNPDIRLHLGDALLNLGKPEQALRQYRCVCVCVCFLVPCSLLCLSSTLLSHQFIAIAHPYCRRGLQQNGQHRELLAALLRVNGATVYCVLFKCAHIRPTVYMQASQATCLWQDYDTLVDTVTAAYVR